MAKTSGDISVEKWEAWVNGMTDQDYVLIVSHGGKLNRTRIAEGCHFARSVLGSNPDVVIALEELEDNLRERGVLPELTPDGEKDSKGRTLVQKESRQASIEQSRVPMLEQQIMELKAENNAIKGKLGRFTEIIDVYKDLDEL